MKLFRSRARFVLKNGLVVYASSGLGHYKETSKITKELQQLTKNGMREGHNGYIEFRNTVYNLADISVATYWVSFL